MDVTHGLQFSKSPAYNILLHCNQVTNQLAQHGRSASMNTTIDTESHAQTPSLPVCWRSWYAATEWAACGGGQLDTNARVSACNLIQIWPVYCLYQIPWRGQVTVTQTIAICLTASTLYAYKNEC